ncbi:ATP-binding protein [Paenibacillus sp. J22TS3]|uniref:ATP-binding protein n=1 Tax=Paenibacillus sp. J22TS3 TaxID=2807192 RepID=UPI001B1B73CE|nr:ATP-binding protein [Paenibacillus sp. J22TS3]GIP22905.1 hypothetical protein J22TS3_31800 [Paenibacillus sp. J22TS3]
MKFTFNSRVIEHLGSDLITKDEIAITELVKNSYDAEAEEIRLHFIENPVTHNFESFLRPIGNQLLEKIKKKSNDQQIVIIEDNGIGMNQEDLQNGFFTIGTDIKKKQKNEKKINSRMPLGEKGIGRLAAQRLSKVLFIETTKLDMNSTLLIMIDWDRLISTNSRIDELELEVQQFEKSSTNYTRLWFVGLNSNFSQFIDDRREEQLSLFDDYTKQLKLKEELLSSLSFLFSPFDNYKTNNFTISAFLNNDEISTDFQNQAIKIAESEHQFKLISKNGKLFLTLSMSIKPWYLERIHLKLLTKDISADWIKEPSYYRHLLEKYQERFSKSLYMEWDEPEIKKRFEGVDLNYLKKITPIEGKVYSFKRDLKLSALAIKSAKENLEIPQNYKIHNIRALLDNHNGIRLYRGNHRIANLGNKGDDWLELQQARTRGQQFYRFELGNTIGYIRINDPYQDFITEISSRLDMKMNEYATSLTGCVKRIFNSYFYQFSQRAYNITKLIIEQEGLLPENVLPKLNETIHATDKVAKESQDHLNEFLNLLSDTLKTSKNIFNSNTLQHLSIVGEKVKTSLDSTISQLNESKSIVKQIENEYKKIELESYNNYKLMANGLVTEVLTHELHSLLSNFDYSDRYEQHFNELKKYLLVSSRDLYTKHLRPLNDRFVFFDKRAKELRRFYSFLEDTFLYNGTADDFVMENMSSFLADMKQRVSVRLIENKIDFDYSTIDMFWEVPKGVLVHIFYNLIDNSIYWIRERKNKQLFDKSLERIEPDIIQLEKKDNDTIYFSDSGTGIFPFMENTLFQPLESGKEKGRGMGLYITRQLIRSFGGEIELLKDRNKHGNRFIFAIYRYKREIEYDE